MKLSRKELEFDLFNFGMSVAPDYDDRDLFNIKAGSKHYKGTSKIGFMGRHPKRMT
jgi:hypothetical protein